MPTYNRSSLLPKAIESVLAQTYPGWELIVVDDGSTDNSREIVEAFIDKDSRIRYLFQENMGQGAARNAGIRGSYCKYIAFLDSDDEWLPEKLKRQVEVLEDHDEYDFCYTAENIVFEGENLRPVVSRHDMNADLSFIKLAGIAVSVPSSHLYRRSAVEKVGPFDEKRELIGLEDNDWSVRGHFLKGFYLDEPLTVYRKHSGQVTRKNVSRNAERQIKGLAYILEKNMAIISANRNALVYRLQQLGHLNMIGGNYPSSRKYFAKAVAVDFLNLKSMLLALMSFIPALYRAAVRLRNVKNS